MQCRSNFAKSHAGIDELFNMIVKGNTDTTFHSEVMRAARKARLKPLKD